MNRITRIEFDHDTKLFTVTELVEDKVCTLRTDNVWCVVQRVQDLNAGGADSAGLPRGRFWIKG